MFKQHRNTPQNILAFLFIGWLIFGANAAVAADDGAPDLRSSDRGQTTNIEGDEVDEPPPDPFATRTANIEGDEVDEPPPDPLASGPGWWLTFLGKLTWFF